jgi:hypothetical protein
MCHPGPQNRGSQKQLSAGLHTNQLHQVLALRGLLAGGILAHVLQKRHLVDYGVNRCEVLLTRHAMYQ